ncbi:MAG: FHA domain-containing protein [Verrucomicrobiae bacterium]|nr:FHA domain-containing protein [Verrucomicrobiae bacterium]
MSNDVILVDDRVSRRHATIHAQGLHEFWLVDLGSRNGTYLNGRRVSQPTRLRDGDRIQVGPFQLTFHLAAPAPDLSQPTSSSEQTQFDLRSIACWLLVVDIIGSTALAQQLSPEELAVVVGGWFARCKEAIEENGGTINKYLGDGLLAYWHATEASLPHVLQALRDLGRLQEKPQPPFRIVIHQGNILLGGLPSSGEESLAGPEVHFVFRQETLAGQLSKERLASASAAALLQPLIPMAPAGEHALAGFDEDHTFYTF